MNKICSFHDCDRIVDSKTLCKAHYTQLYRGRPLSSLINKPVCIEPKCTQFAKKETLCLKHFNAQTVKICIFHNCKNVADSHNLCVSHARQKRAGKPLRPLKGARLNKNHKWKDRVAYALAQHTQSVDNGCIEYIWAENAKYPTLVFEGISYPAHRLAMALKLGSLEAIQDETVHHKCANTRCCNPEHLELATQAENMAEMFARRAYEATITRLEKRVAKLELQLKSLGQIIACDDEVFFLDLDDED